MTELGFQYRPIWTRAPSHLLTCPSLWSQVGVKAFGKMCACLAYRSQFSYPRQPERKRDHWLSSKNQCLTFILNLISQKFLVTVLLHFFLPFLFMSLGHSIFSLSLSTSLSSSCVKAECVPIFQTLTPFLHSCGTLDGIWAYFSICELSMWSLRSL